jgi:hypothetical protein
MAGFGWLRPDYIDRSLAERALVSANIAAIALQIAAE